MLIDSNELKEKAVPVFMPTDMEPCGHLPGTVQAVLVSEIEAMAYRNKIRTPFAHIIVNGTPQSPYYNILYLDPADGEYHVGFGSFYLGNVFKWLREEFELIREDDPAIKSIPVKDLYDEDGEQID